MRTMKKTVAGMGILAMLASAGVAGASFGGTRTEGAGFGAAALDCPGGMTRLGHPFSEDMSIFPEDPAIHIEIEYTVAEHLFLVEDIDTGAHAGTHLDVPAHFIEGGRTVDQLDASEFVWPVYKMDVRGMSFDDNLITKSDIRRYERRNGRIPRGALVVLQTGAEQFWGLEGPGDERVVNPDDNALNVDDLFDFVNPGFSGDAVQWMFNGRHIDGVGSDAYGPDAATDPDFEATFTTLDNDGVALVAIANLDSVAVRGDIIIASTVALEDGSGFTTDPIACHGRHGGERRQWENHDYKGETD